MLTKNLKIVQSEGKSIGLNLNVSKCEYINEKGFSLNHDFCNFIQLVPMSAQLLGAPLVVGPAMDTSLQ